MRNHMRCLFQFLSPLFVLVLLSGASSALLASHGDVADSQQPGIEVSLRLDQSPQHGLAFTVSLRNSGAADRLLHLGSLAGEKPLYDHIVIGLRGADGQRYDLHWDPIWRSCNCRPLMVPLPPEATYSLSFDLSDIRWVKGEDEGGEGFDWLPPGTYIATVTVESVEAWESFRSTGPMPEVWEGRVVSNDLIIPLEALLE